MAGLQGRAYVDIHGFTNKTGTRFQIRPIPPAHPDFRLALCQVFNLDPAGAYGPQLQRCLPLHDAASGKLASQDFLLGVYDHRRLVNSCLTLVSPGAAAMVMIPPGEGRSEEREALVDLLGAVQTEAWKRSVALLELLVEPGHCVIAEALTVAGFRHLTRLVYLRRMVAEPHTMSVRENDVEWVPYTPETEPLFLSTLEQTYVQSLDCPELTGIRTTADVLAGHRAVGQFDPSLWWIAKRRQGPVGLILLNRILSEAGLEVVYVGVVCSARGTGVADALLARGIELAIRVGAKELALAVDCRNALARRVYRRWGFVETGQREAWIASVPPISGG